MTPVERMALTLINAQRVHQGLDPLALETLERLRSWPPQESYLAMARAALGLPQREPCNRAASIIARAENCHWITVHDRDQLRATLRTALDTEVEAGGPNLNNGWNK